MGENVTVQDDQIRIDLEVDERLDISWEELSNEEKQLVVSSVEAARKIWSGNQCFSVKHNGPKQNGSNHCGGDVLAFFDNGGNVEYKCQNCGYTWAGAML